MTYPKPIEEKCKNDIYNLRIEYERKIKLLTDKHLEAYIPGNDSQQVIAEKIEEKVTNTKYTPAEIGNEWLKIMDKIVPEDQINKYKIVYTRVKELIAMLQ